MKKTLIIASMIACFMTSVTMVAGSTEKQVINGSTLTVHFNERLEWIKSCSITEQNVKKKVDDFCTLASSLMRWNAKDQVLYDCYEKLHKRIAQVEEHLGKADKIKLLQADKRDKKKSPYQVNIPDGIRVSTFITSYQKDPPPSGGRSKSKLFLMGMGGCSLAVIVIGATLYYWKHKNKITSSASDANTD